MDRTEEVPSPMPPAAVKSIRDLIFWQYAKIMSESAGLGKKRFRFVMDRFKKLKTGQIEWSGAIREYILEREVQGQCTYCGTSDGLSLDHLMPLSRGGPDVADNGVVACKSCNSSKGSKGLYEWFHLEKRYEVPRIAEGKYLKLLYHVHAERGTLDVERVGLKELCVRCEIGHLCPETDLTVYCLESVLSRGA